MTPKTTVDIYPKPGAGVAKMIGATILEETDLGVTVRYTFGGRGPLFAFLPWSTIGRIEIPESIAVNA